MKGLTHFMSGVALGSFFAPAVRMASATRLQDVDGATSSMILVLGGLYGILPDTLDFKVGQFLSRAEVQVDCDPVDPDPQKMAEQAGRAIDRVAESGRKVRVQFAPMRVGADLWRQYMIRFDGRTNEVVIVLNEVVTTGQIPFPGSAPPEEKRIGRYRLRKARLLPSQGKPSVVDIFSGPQFGFHLQGDHVMVEFLPWHRTWSHSYTLGALLALIPMLLALAFGWPSPWLYGLVAFLGFSIHITEDLTGHMGGQLFWPFQRRRTEGLGLFSASHASSNFLTIYASMVIILYNLDRFSTRVIPFGALEYYLLFLVLPAAIYLAIARLTRKATLAPKKKGELSAMEALQRREALKREELEFEGESVPAG